jgi:hypothetical protein
MYVKTYVIFVAVSGGRARTFIDLKTKDSTTMNNSLHIDHALLSSAAHNRSNHHMLHIRRPRLEKWFPDILHIGS